MIGIANINSFPQKTAYLLFDQIYLAGLSSWHEDSDALDKDLFYKEYLDANYLASVGIIKNLNYKDILDTYGVVSKEEIHEDDLKLIKYIVMKRQRVFDGLETWRSFGQDSLDQIYLRRAMVYMKYAQGIDCVPVLKEPLYTTVQDCDVFKTENKTILNIILSNFPLLDENTPIEQIVEIHKDTDARSKLLLFRRWMKKLAKDKISPNEIQDEFDFLVNEYQSYMKIQKLKYKVGVFQTLITSPLEIIENLTKLKFKKLADPFFSLYQKKIDLLEAELGSPGREVSYSIYVKEKFVNE